jgi:hypothetical protein
MKIIFINVSIDTISTNDYQLPTKDESILHMFLRVDNFRLLDASVTGLRSVSEAPLTYCLMLLQCHSHKVDSHPNHCLSPNAVAAEQKI